MWLVMSQFQFSFWRENLFSLFIIRDLCQAVGCVRYNILVRFLVHLKNVDFNSK